MSRPTGVRQARCISTGSRAISGISESTKTGSSADRAASRWGHYTLQPKRKSGADWPAQTPAITGPGQPVGKPGPGYKADAILLHPEGRPGEPDSLSCLTLTPEGFRRVMHLMHQAPDSIVPLVVAET